MRERTLQIARSYISVAAVSLAFAAAVQAAELAPVARWDFGAEETTPLQIHGGVHRDVPGPRPPVYPDFDPKNTAVKLDGSGAHLSFDDSGDSEFDFRNGETISLEAWVQIDDMHNGENVYVIGKGRTGARGFPPDNQNWALRVRGVSGKACISFLFATVRKADQASDAHWHRWTAKDGFTPGKSWHHVAVSYKFGEPESLRAWLDGKPQAGAWDMGGMTREPPVVDNDAVWIGSSQGGNRASSLRGSIDSIAIHRGALTDAVVKARFRRVGEDESITKPAPEIAPDLDPRGRVVMTFHEGMPVHDRWLNEEEVLPPETLRWETNSMLLDRLPRKYDDWGIRDDWKAPVLVRMAADVHLPPGRHQIMMRVRGLSRLWVDGVVVARSKPLLGSPNGEEAITPVPVPPIPGIRLAEHRQQEVLAEIEVPADKKNPCRVTLETMVGGKSFRPDPGEICVAGMTSDNRMFFLVGANSQLTDGVPLTDAAVTAELARVETEMREFDDIRRQEAAASQNAFWKKRHELAKTAADRNPISVPASGAKHPIDAFLKAKVDRALAESAKTSIADAKKFYSDVLPILRDECFRCHGHRPNGGLQLTTLESAKRGGDSGLPAIVPAQPAESELIRRITATDSDERMPPGPEGLKPEQIATLQAWIQNGANWPAPPVTEADVAAPRKLDDAEFLRRVFLDTVGVPPTEEEFAAFMRDASPHKREHVIDRLLADERWADHQMSYWLDVLAENPTLINSSLNTTGPFRWFLYESFRDGKAFDRMVTELILMRGSIHGGGSAGFRIAGDNDAPYAAKAQIIAKAFLGIEMQCARCHDAPYHSVKQKDLYSLAAMLERKSVIVPKSSRVPVAFFESKARESLIKVTLKPDEQLQPKLPFDDESSLEVDPTLADSLTALMHDPRDTREQLAAFVTTPENERFGEVIVNRVWQRLLGAGLVEPVDDWEGHSPSHPELLKWLANDFVSHGYDLRRLSRLILTSDVYQREATGKNSTASPETRFFVAPDRRRLTAEQIVDSLHAAAGKVMDVEELTFDPDGRRPESNRLTLGRPTRAWMFANLANERDRPSLGFPKAMAITDIMVAFGWTGARQNPRTDRETSPHVLQPGVLANSTASICLTRASVGSELAELAVEASTPESLVDQLFVRYLSRMPKPEERSALATQLAEGFENRLVPANEIVEPKPLPPLPRVTWSNHLRAESNSIAIEMEKRARLGPPADPRLQPAWREAYEDAVWSLINLSEFVWMP